MKTNRLWAIGTTIIVVAVVALGWLLGISPKLAEAASSQASADLVDAENFAQQQEIIALKAAYENIDEVRDQLEELEKSVPPTKDIPDFIRQLNTMASENGVVLSSITTASAASYAESVVSTIPEVAAANLAMGPENLVLIPLNIKLSGSYDAFINFGDALQTGDRLFLVTGLTVNAGSDPATPEPIVTINGKVQEPVEAEVQQFTGELNGFIFVVLNPNTPIEDIEEEEPVEEPTPTPTPTEPTPEPTETVAALRR